MEVTKKNKTWATEVTFLLLAILVWTIYQENLEVVKVIIFPILSFASVVFGLKRVDASDKLFGTKPS